MTALNINIEKITNTIIERSKTTRGEYLSRMHKAEAKGIVRDAFSCSNMAHACAAASLKEKVLYTQDKAPNLGIITAYNDMLSAHQPYQHFPDYIKKIALRNGATAQVASGVPAMCDGVTQSEVGMELSLFSRDIIAMAAAVGLSHQCYDAAIFLGICDKIIPGLTIASATFGHIPAIMLPAGPMPSGISNEEKATVRQQFAEKKISSDALLRSEMKSYHSPGTCTFYGTANTNQLMMEMLGLHLPGASFINPYTPLRDALTQHGVKRAIEMRIDGKNYLPAYQILTEKNFVNALVGLLASGGSTNLIIHTTAMARAAGIIIDIQDYADLSKVVPLINRTYPNGVVDINGFHAAGGMALFVRELLSAGLLHQDVKTVSGGDMREYVKTPVLDENGVLEWQDIDKESKNPEVIATAKKPFSPMGGLEVLKGNVGRAVIKISAIKPEQYVIEAPAKVFHTQEAVKQAFEAGELNQDFICVVRFQGAKANGMPELHGLTPILGSLQSKGYKVALVTDGRMSGASGKVPAAIHLSPEALAGGNIAKIEDGDIIKLDANAGTLTVLADDFESRQPVTIDLSDNEFGCGRELFQLFRDNAGSAEQGASIFN